MNIRNSSNLKYDRTSNIFQETDEYEKGDMEPRVCILESFERKNGTLKLYFKNRTHAVIRAKNLEGSEEIDLVTQKLDNFIGRSYEEILEEDF
ncbi:MAG: hypothetical protein PHF07_00440 [Candidatus Pacebacteria bacterium]|jgi:hypothetical protein|nr:hypothetical protein [Candidatus Paceibacterota bacterium]